MKTFSVERPAFSDRETPLNARRQTLNVVP